MGMRNPISIDKTFAVAVLASLIGVFAVPQAFAAGADVSCTGTLLGERLCANLPVLPSDRHAPSMATKSDLSGDLAPHVAFVAERFNRHDDNADYQLAESADGSLALGEGERANNQIYDVENRLKGWQIQGGQNKLPSSGAPIVTPSSKSSHPLYH